ncbi:MAG TPA: response regulator [Anaerolineae bacterium]|jgi:DNA-binding response OmpR family regulator|nr:response regulator [Anaerolineae bacterium]
MAAKKRILVAEDEPDIRGLIVFTLQYAGFEVVEAFNGQDAVEKAAVVKPDLILLDVRMPKMTGYEACQVLKAEEATRPIPVIFLSARGQDAEVKFGLELGAEEYILKPFAPDDLLRRVDSIFQRLARSGVES